MASTLGAFAHPFDDAATTAARVAAAAEAGKFDMPPIMAQLLGAVSVERPVGQAVNATVVNPSPAANVPDGDKAAEPSGWAKYKVWIIAAAVVAGLFVLPRLFRGRRG